jgi:transcription elongation GreA/GreB family factor
MASVGEHQVAVGSLVRVRWSDEPCEDEYTIVADDTDLARSRVSASTPFAQAVLGRSAGDRVIVRAAGGRCRVTIVAVAAIAST